ncbi:galactoside alpha-(1,2)-fucosyltransferase 2-like isoform X29 [Eriocheir sinensis]|uniref:galactoside alpha-(1,2)-fucosyltransferase 2-like isoform X29 n=1 Tax=Eriocheir sinensis TaxID=95602 RepID=UPI0021C95B9B|nr:galactoside alpha-(1,2)-fucosyltransferase 2-like isoform X29 [Eriocheir sinensis]
MRCCGALLPRGQGGRRCVLLAITVLTVLFLHLLVHRQVVEPLIFLRQWADVGERVPVGEVLQVTSGSPSTTPPRQSTVKNESKATTVKKDDPFKNQVILNKWPPKVKFPLMLFNNPGRLGNRLSSYAFALTFHAAHNATATTAVTRDSMNQLVALLDTAYLTLPVVDGNLIKEAKNKKAHVSVGIPSWKKNDMVSHLEPAYQRGEKEYRESGKPKMYSLKGHHHTIRAAFRFKEDLKQKVAKFLEGVRQKRGRRDITFVGFHIRRTDYRRVIKSFFKCTSPLPGLAFYQSAMNHYRATLRNPVFVVASDDLSYARQHLNTSTDVEFTDMKTAAEDMVLLGSCSHSIMTVGSFGFWASFFAGGQVVYPLITNCTLKPFVHPDHLGPRGYENWKAFDTDGGGPV